MHIEFDATPWLPKPTSLAYEWQITIGAFTTGLNSDSPMPTIPGLYLVEINNSAVILQIVSYNSVTMELKGRFRSIKHMRNLLSRE